ncbi:ATP-binding protein [Paenisporosarcina sp. TG-14]|uniref:ATP-binding protein n=1 Tax=Paenisporosarcina sp. TG-14 TaxID=1231057 RepID=UPI0002F31ECC|nr:sensor histidine kinase [Paenisporosarcina sp. TG-14]
MELTKHFLFNLSLMIVLLFFCVMWAEKSGKVRLNKGTALSYFILSSILCFMFSYQLNEELILDLRIVPFMVGGLYLGLSPILGLFIIITRGFHGFDIGFLSSLIFYGLFSFLIWCIYPWFLKLTSKCRILFSVGITILVSLIILVILEILNLHNNKLDVWVAYLFIPPLGVAMISYIMEVIEKNILLRQRLLKVEKLQAVEQMGAAISHEIRNPLTSAMGFVQLLEDDSIESKDRTQYLAILKGELESAERVIQDYLTFSKPQIELVEEIDVHVELHHVLNLLQPIANLNSVEVSTKFPSCGLIKGDRQKFHQCFINVMKNSIESMPNGGVLSIETVFTKNNVLIQVKDTGIGMTEEELVRLGEPYYSTKGTKGTGLGIMVVFSIVKAMKGTIKVQSKFGDGTTFHISFLSSVTELQESL